MCPVRTPGYYPPSPLCCNCRFQRCCKSRFCNCRFEKGYGEHSCNCRFQKRWGQWTVIPKLREWAVYRGRAGGEKLPAPTLQQVPLLRTAFNTTSLVTQCQWKRGGGHGTLKSIRCQEADTPSTGSGQALRQAQGP